VSRPIRSPRTMGTTQTNSHKGRGHIRLALKVLHDVEELVIHFLLVAKLQLDLVQIGERVLDVELPVLLLLLLLSGRHRRGRNAQRLRRQLLLLLLLQRRQGPAFAPDPPSRPR
jgi:hypothetical protein